MLAKFEARLSQARTFKQALAIYADSNMKNPHQVAMHSELNKFVVFDYFHVFLFVQLIYVKFKMMSIDNPHNLKLQKVKIENWSQNIVFLLSM